MRLKLGETAFMQFDVGLIDPKSFSKEQLLKSLSFSTDEADKLESLSAAELQDYLNPQESDYVLVPVRMLSASDKVQSGLFNFGYNGGKALQDAVELFNGVIILKDHRPTVDGWVGKTLGATWDTSTPGAPAGITGMMKLDKKADPKLVRGVVSGMVNSVSVTVGFQWQQSHPDMKESEFWQKLGQKVDGRTVQLDVIKIDSIRELSLVYLGADGYAKTIDKDGNLTSGTRTESNSFQPPPISQQEESMNLKALLAKFGITSLGDNPTEEQISAALTTALAQAKQEGIDSSTGSVTKLTSDLNAAQEALKLANTNLEAEQKKTAELSVKATIADAYLTAERNEAVRLYKIAEGTKASETMLSVISSGTLEQVQAFAATFKPQAEKIAPLSCTKCGCTELSRKQTQNSHDGSTQDDGSTQKKTDSLESKKLKGFFKNLHPDA